MRSIFEVGADIGDPRYADIVVPDLGPYEIETPPHPLGGFDWANSKVVDLRKPNEGWGNGFAYVFSGTFAECDAWIEDAERAAAGAGGA